MRFTPANINSAKNETIRFVVTNIGKLKHKLVLGSVKELKVHNELMTKIPGREHDELNQIACAPGATGEIIWQFSTP